MIVPTTFPVRKQNVWNRSLLSFQVRWICVRMSFQLSVILMFVLSIEPDSQHGGKMSARDRAQARQVNVDFNTHADSRHPGPSRQQSGQGRGFNMNRPPQGQQIGQTPMSADQAAQQRRQVQTDRHEDSKRKRAFNTDLTDSTREQTSLANPDAGGSRSGFATPREDVDDATAE